MLTVQVLVAPPIILILRMLREGACSFKARPGSVMRLKAARKPARAT